MNQRALPKVVNTTDWHFEAVQEYVHRLQQCYKWQRYEHVGKYTAGVHSTCVKRKGIRR